ncbi:hypothetical protein RRG08_038650, partial [Elysia crispata]
RRELNRKKAAQLLREGKKSEAKGLPPEMYVETEVLIVIVAPYEADAQLAYLNLQWNRLTGYIQNGFLWLRYSYLKSHLNEVLAIQNSFYSFEKFPYMCILSGCDYLPSLPGIGLVKACKVFENCASTRKLRLAYQIALGNVDIHTHKCLAFFDPATFKPKTTERPQYRHQLSIWDPEYRIKTSGSPCKPIQANAGENGKWKAVHSKTRTVHVDLLQCVPIKPEPLKDPGKLTVAAERLLMSQYEASR